MQRDARVPRRPAGLQPPLSGPPASAPHKGALLLADLGVLRGAPSPRRSVPRRCPTSSPSLSVTFTHCHARAPGRGGTAMTRTGSSVSVGAAAPPAASLSARYLRWPFHSGRPTSRAGCRLAPRSCFPWLPPSCSLVWGRCCWVPEPKGSPAAVRWAAWDSCVMAVSLFQLGPCVQGEGGQSYVEHLSHGGPCVARLMGTALAPS